MNIRCREKEQIFTMENTKENTLESTNKTCISNMKYRHLTMLHESSI